MRLLSEEVDETSCVLMEHIARDVGLLYTSRYETDRDSARCG